MTEATLNYRCPKCGNLTTAKPLNGDTCVCNNCGVALVAKHTEVNKLEWDILDIFPPDSTVKAPSTCNNCNNCSCN